MKRVWGERKYKDLRFVWKEYFLSAWIPQGLLRARVRGAVTWQFVKDVFVTVRQKPPRRPNPPASEHDRPPLPMAEYVERHAIAATLTAAVNDTISKLPDNPYGAMVRCSSSPG